METVHAELIDRNKLIRELIDFRVDVTGVRSRRAQYLADEVERFIREEIVQLVREMPYYTV